MSPAFFEVPEPPLKVSAVRASASFEFRVLSFELETRNS